MGFVTWTANRDEEHIDVRARDSEACYGQRRREKRYCHRNDNHRN